MKKINFELSEEIVKWIEKAVDFRIYDSGDLEDAIKIILGGHNV